MDLEQAAAFYRRKGYNPLPSKDCGGRLHPPFRYGDARDEGLSAESFAEIANRLECDAIQVATGPRHRLVVVDLDGPMSRRVWDTWTRHRNDPPTWAVQHNPEGGMHLWYSVRESAVIPFKTWLWWQGETPHESNHNAIEVLGEGNLIVSPPSVSPKSGKPYRFLPGRGPREIGMPAMLPEWLADMIAARSARESRPVVKPSLVRPDATPVSRVGLDWDDVRNAIPDKVGLLESWGVRVVSRRPSSKGWYTARSIFREDKHPSASVNEFGDYWEPDMASGCMSIFQVAVALGLYRSFPEAVDGIGLQFGVEKRNV